MSKKRVRSSVNKIPWDTDFTKGWHKSLGNKKRHEGDIAVSNGIVKGFRKLSITKRLNLATKFNELQRQYTDSMEAYMQKYVTSDVKPDKHKDIHSYFDDYFFEKMKDDDWKCKVEPANEFGVQVRDDMPAGVLAQLGYLVDTGLLVYE